MFYKNRWKKTLGLLSLSLALSGCFETGENQGSNLLTINGSLLKGSTQNADIIVYDSQGRIIWQGKSDNQGNYNAELSSPERQTYTIVARITNQSTMTCDAVECIAPLSGNRYVFGDSMPGIELGNIEIKSLLYLDAPTDSITTRNAIKQVNSMSSLLVDMVEQDLSSNMDKQAYDSIINAANGAVVSALGVELNDGQKILAMTLPNINQTGSTANSSGDEASLGVINAGQSSSLTRMEQFSDALVTLKSSPDNPQARTILSEAQNQMMLEAKALIEDPSLNINSEILTNSINYALENGVDFSALEQSLSALNLASAQANSSVQALNYSASSYQYGGTANTASAQRPQQWWWVSTSNATGTTPHSVALEYANAFTPTRLAIGISELYNGGNTQLQVSEDGQNWQDLADLNSLSPDANTLDPRQVRHLTWTLAPSITNGERYRFYRLLSESSNELWLEYLCISQDSTANSKNSSNSKSNALDHCNNSPAPISSQVSSVAVSAENIKNPSKNTWWVSEIASPAPQWAMIEYAQAFVATQASITVHQLNQGTSAIIQGSTDGQQWTDIAPIPTTQVSGETIDEQGFRQFDLALNNTQSYQYYRYYSLPTSFVRLAFLSFSGN